MMGDGMNGGIGVERNGAKGNDMILWTATRAQRCNDSKLEA